MQGRLKENSRKSEWRELVDQLRLDAVYSPLLAISTAFRSACALFIDS